MTLHQFRYDIVCTSWKLNIDMGLTYILFPVGITFCRAWHIFYFQLRCDIVWTCWQLSHDVDTCHSWHTNVVANVCQFPSPVLHFQFPASYPPPLVPIPQLIWYFIVNFLILALGVAVPGQLPNFAYSINSMKLSDFKWIHSNKDLLYLYILPALKPWDVSYWCYLNWNVKVKVCKEWRPVYNTAVGD